MDRRAFLRTLGGVLVSAAAPTKRYAFFGNILRPKAELVADYTTWLTIPIEYRMVIQQAVEIATLAGYKRIELGRSELEL